jgi:hypothetical protein
MGRQTITVTASNVADAVVATHTITICYWADLNCDTHVDVGDISDIAAHWPPGRRPTEREKKPNSSNYLLKPFSRSCILRYYLRFAHFSQGFQDLTLMSDDSR